jgi:hypothetical protein
MPELDAEFVVWCRVFCLRPDFEHAVGFESRDGSIGIVTVGDMADVRLRIIKQTSLFIVEFALSIAALDSTIALHRQWSREFDPVSGRIRWRQTSLLLRANDS